MCRGLGITLSRFFADGETVEVTPELKELIELWLRMTPKQKTAAKEILHSIINLYADSKRSCFVPLVAFFILFRTFRQHSAFSMRHDSFRGTAKPLI